MSETKRRVGAIFGSDSAEKIIMYLGAGVLEGEFVPGPEVTGWMGEYLRKNGRLNPRIKLDNGDTVYGCECWWGSEDDMTKYIEKWKSEGWIVVNVRIDDKRKEAVEA